MTTGSITNKRQMQIRELRPDWLDVIEDSYIEDGAVAMTVWPDEEIIYFGTEEEYKEVVKRYNLDHETTGKRDDLWGV